MLRVIAGELRGRRLRTPDGYHTRPTADRVRQALFNILGPPPPLATALDLFAGSGALGIEALSRGVAHVVFVDSDADACRALRRNLQALGLGGRAAVRELPVQRALQQLTRCPPSPTGPPFDWIFADPPYAQGALPALLAELGRPPAPLLKPHAVVILEHARHGVDAPGLQSAESGLHRYDHRCYGQTALSFYATVEPDVDMAAGAVAASKEDGLP